jgi:predicted nucleic acid-binding protein
MGGSFIDSNVLLYQLSSDTDKAERAEALIRTGGVISVQVLNEIASVAHRKMGMDWPDVRGLSQTFRALLKVIPLDEEIHANGLDLCARYGFSLYDGMIVAAALAAGCDRLWSEDMHNGLHVDDRLTIFNPFNVAG